MTVNNAIQRHSTSFPYNTNVKGKARITLRKKLQVQHWDQGQFYFAEGVTMFR